MCCISYTLYLGAEHMVVRYLKIDSCWAHQLLPNFFVFSLLIIFLNKLTPFICIPGTWDLLMGDIGLLLHVCWNKDFPAFKLPRLYPGYLEATRSTSDCWGGASFMALPQANAERNKKNEDGFFSSGGGS